MLSGASALTYHMLLNSTSTQLQISRFELRILRFFNDICVPMLTFGVNKRHDHIYKHVMPRYFVKSKLLRLAIYSYGCLVLWPFLDLDTVLAVDLLDEKEVLQLQDNDVGSLSVLFRDASIFGEDEDTNIFRRTAEYYSETLIESQKALEGLDTKLGVFEQEQLEKLICVILSSSLIIGFLGCHPHRVVPLVRTDKNHKNDSVSDPGTDLLTLTTGMKQMVLSSLDSLKNSDVGDLFQQDELQMVSSRGIPIVSELRRQMHEHYAEIDFLDFDFSLAEEMTVLGNTLDMLGKALALCDRFNYPVALFRWMFGIPLEFSDLIESGNPIALRTLFVYSCLCLYCHFYIHHECIWRDYVEWYSKRLSPLGEFDRRVYEFFVTRDKKVQKENFRKVAKFNVWGKEFNLQPF